MLIACFSDSPCSLHSVSTELHPSYSPAPPPTPHLLLTLTCTSKNTCSIQNIQDLTQGSISPLIPANASVEEFQSLSVSSCKEGLFTVCVIFYVLISGCKTTVVHGIRYKMNHSHVEDETGNRTGEARNEVSIFFDELKTSVTITFCACCYSAFLLNDLFMWQKAKNRSCF